MKTEKQNPYNSNIEFNIVEYDLYNKARIEEFCDKYDLSSVHGISSIPLSEGRKYPDGGRSVVYMPEQILSRKATEYKKEKKYELAIACLKKANELFPLSFYAYNRKNYERLVDLLVLSGDYQEARKEHLKLDHEIGTYLQMLEKMKESSGLTNEQKKLYQKNIIDPHIQEERDREQYYYLLEKYSSLAPKSFSAYRRMKKSVSDKYKNIVNILKSEGEELERIQFWL